MRICELVFLGGKTIGIFSLSSRFARLRWKGIDATGEAPVDDVRSGSGGGGVSKEESCETERLIPFDMLRDELKEAASCGGRERRKRADDATPQTSKLGDNRL